MSVFVAAARGDIPAPLLVAGLAAAITATFLWPLDGRPPKETR